MATVKVSALSPLNATSATFTYGITNSNTEGKVAIGGAGDGLATLVSPAFTGNPTAPTQSSVDNSTHLATTAYVDSAISILYTAPTFNSVVAGTGANFTFPIGLPTIAFIYSTGTITGPVSIDSSPGDPNLGWVLGVVFLNAASNVTYGASFVATHALALPASVSANTTLLFNWDSVNSHWVRFL